MRACRCALLLAVLGSMEPAAGALDVEKCKMQGGAALMHALLREAGSKEGIVLDVGANGGCEMMAALKQGRRVIGFECLESAYHDIHGVPQIMGNPNATLLHACAGNTTRIAALTLARDSSSLIEANVRKNTKAAIKAPKEGPAREPVLVVPIDALVPPAEHVAAIKIDVQGAEYSVLQGLVQTITREHPVVAYEDTTWIKTWEKHGKSDELLASLGYVCTNRGMDKICCHANKCKRPHDN